MVCWVVTLSGILFFVLNKAELLRVPREIEEAGADVSKHGGYAYPEQMVLVETPSTQQATEMKTTSGTTGSMRC